MQKSPCYKCELRTLGCHGKCKAYINWKSELNTINKNKENYRDIYDFRYRRVVFNWKRNRHEKLGYM